MFLAEEDAAYTLAFGAACARGGTYADNRYPKARLPCWDCKPLVLQGESFSVLRPLESPRISKSRTLFFDERQS